MSTKLPEAFERKSDTDAPEEYQDNSHEMFAWSGGYNSALERTGAKELWEALQAVDEWERKGNHISEGIIELVRAALNKHTNTV